MNLFELFVKIGVDDQASGKLSKLSSGLGKGLATAAKIGTAAVGAAAAGITALTKSAVENYAEYEQLVGGVETLFKNSADKVQEYAANAYKTAGLSANEYMSTVTSFSASLLQSLGGDTEAAANFADMAISDMSDNANKMGTSMEMIQNAYQGFAKQNYTMLDNLKLGYGGTKTEMERLLRDAEKMGGLVEGAFDIDSFADVVEAINIVQTEMGITGTTALEAGRTISGSVGAMKSAWTNLVTGFADKNADIEGLINNLVTTIVGDGTENNLGVIGNVLPAVETALFGIVKLIEGGAPKIIEILPGLVERIIPSLISSASALVGAVLNVLPGLIDMLVDALIDNAPMLIVAAIELFSALAIGLVEAIPKIIDALPEIVNEIGKALQSSEIFQKLVQVGKNIIDGIKQGISNAWNNLVKWFKGLFGDLISIAKKILGIKSPSRVFRDQIGKQMAAGLGLGWEDEFGKVKSDIEDSLDFDDASVGINASIRKVGAGAGFGGFGGTSIGNINITVNGANYSNEQSLAEAIAMEIQSMTDRRAAVYA